MAYRTLVTGASGLIGQRLCELLLGQGETVVAFCRNPEDVPLSSRRLERVAGDLVDSGSVLAAMDGCNRCFHLAALAAQWHPDPTMFEKVNVEGTRAVLSAAGKLKIKKLVYTSTAGVFGSAQNGVTIDESSSPPDWLPTEYERTKRAAELDVLRAAELGIPAVCVNPTRVFGPGPLNQSNSVAKLMREYQQGTWRWLPGNGAAIGNYAYLDDVVRGHLAAMDRGKIGKRYILGGENLSYRQLFRCVGEVIGKKRWLVPIPFAVLDAYARFEQFKADRFGWTPKLTPAFVDKYRRDYRLSSRLAIDELGYEITPVARAITETLGLSKTTEV